MFGSNRAFRADLNVDDQGLFIDAKAIIASIAAEKNIAGDRPSIHRGE